MQRNVGVVLVTLLALVVCSGCIDTADMAKIKQDVAVLDQNVDAVQAGLVAWEAEQEALQAAIAALPPGAGRDELEAKRAEIDAFIAAAQGELTQLKPVLANLQTRIAAAEDNVDVVEALIKSAAEGAPQPYGTFIGMLGLLGVAVWRWVLSQKAAQEAAAKDLGLKSVVAGANQVISALPETSDKGLTKEQAKTMLETMQQAAGAVTVVRSAMGK